MGKPIYDKCVYPDWCGGYEIGTHNFDKDGFCIICGKTKQQSLCNTLKEVI